MPIHAGLPSRTHLSANTHAPNLHTSQINQTRPSSGSVSVSGPRLNALLEAHRVEALRSLLSRLCIFVTVIFFLALAWQTASIARDNGIGYGTGSTGANSDGNDDGTAPAITWKLQGGTEQTQNSGAGAFPIDTVVTNGRFCSAINALVTITNYTSAGAEQLASTAKSATSTNTNSNSNNATNVWIFLYSLDAKDVNGWFNAQLSSELAQELTGTSELLAASLRDGATLTQITRPFSQNYNPKHCELFLHGGTLIASDHSSAKSDSAEIAPKSLIITISVSVEGSEDAKVDLEKIKIEIVNLEEIDAATGNHAAIGSTAEFFDGSVFVFGGLIQKKVGNDVEMDYLKGVHVYNTTTEKWISLTPKLPEKTNSIDENENSKGLRNARIEISGSNVKNGALDSRFAKFDSSMVELVEKQVFNPLNKAFSSSVIVPLELILDEKSQSTLDVNETSGSKFVLFYGGRRLDNDPVNSKYKGKNPTLGDLFAYSFAENKLYEIVSEDFYRSDDREFYSRFKSQMLFNYDEESSRGRLYIFGGQSAGYEGQFRYDNILVTTLTAKVQDVAEAKVKSLSAKCDVRTDINSYVPYCVFDHKKAAQQASSSIMSSLKVESSNSGAKYPISQSSADLNEMFSKSVDSSSKPIAIESRELLFSFDIEARGLNLFTKRLNKFVDLEDGATKATSFVLTLSYKVIEDYLYIFTTGLPNSFFIFQLILLVSVISFLIAAVLLMIQRPQYGSFTNFGYYGNGSRNNASAFDRSVQSGPPQGADETVIKALPVFSFDKKKYLESKKHFTSQTGEVELTILGKRADKVDEPVGGDLMVEDVLQEDEDSICCCICLCDFDDGDVCRILPCQHLFHPDCVDVWLRKNRSCPMCKQDIMNDDGTLLRNPSAYNSHTFAAEVAEAFQDDTIRNLQQPVEAHSQSFRQNRRRSSRRRRQRFRLLLRSSTAANSPPSHNNDNSNNVNNTGQQRQEPVGTENNQNNSNSNYLGFLRRIRHGYRAGQQSGTTSRINSANTEGIIT